MDRVTIKRVSALIPRMNDLLCITGRISSTEIQNSSLYHDRILKCRSLIHLLPEIIASPIEDDPERRGIYILAKPEFFSTGKIQSKLSDMNIEYSKPANEVTQQMYKVCLFCAISIRIAPEWNKLNEYFIQGKYFIGSLSHPTNAMKMGIAVTEGKACFTLLPARVRVPPLSLENLPFTPQIVKNFIANDNGIMVLNGFQSQKSWVHLLPRLGKGKVISVLKKIPKNSTTKDYQQLSRFWENMYGYLLPESDDGLIYYEISFPGLGVCSYTYPSCCVRSGRLENLGLKNADDSTNQFLKDLAEKVPEIFGAAFILEVVGKENIPNTGPRGARNAGKILNCQGISQNLENGSNRDSTFSGKNLGEALNMKPFLKTLAPGSSKPLPVIQNTRQAEGCDVLEIAASSYEKEQGLQKLLLQERRKKVETICSSQLIQDKHLVFNADEISVGQEVEVRSSYFEDFQKKEHDTEKGSQLGATLSSNFFKRCGTVELSMENKKQKLTGITDEEI